MRNVGSWFLRIACPCLIVFFVVPVIWWISQGDWRSEIAWNLLLLPLLIHLTVLAWKR